MKQGKSWLEQRAKRGTKSVSSGSKQRSYKWTCGAGHERCTGSTDVNIGARVHGNREGAVRCIRRANK